MPRFATGLVVGRFDPPHLGHSYLVESALADCERLVVYVNSRITTDAVPGDVRAGWLAELHPAAEVRLVRHDLDTDFADEALWAMWMAMFREHWPHEAGPHAVFSSDPYIDELARRFDARPVVVDAARATVPVSATLVRTAPSEHLHRLAPPVRRWVEEHWT
jgi:HTH-type transcriptional regulator, transcriptional repressor of NAD biosynthesis genes